MTQAELVRALDHVGALLDAARVPWALMGGLALLLHGYRNRTTRDIDVAVGEGVGAREVIAVLRGGGRVYTPPLLSVVGSGCGRFYVVLEREGEGPEGDGGEGRVVEVDVILAGEFGFNCWWMGGLRGVYGFVEGPTFLTADGLLPRASRRAEIPGWCDGHKNDPDGRRATFISCSLCAAVVSGEATCAL